MERFRACFPLCISARITDEQYLPAINRYSSLQVLVSQRTNGRGRISKHTSGWEMRLRIAGSLDADQRHRVARARDISTWWSEMTWPALEPGRLAGFTRDFGTGNLSDVRRVSGHNVGASSVSTTKLHFQDCVVRDGRPWELCGSSRGQENREPRAKRRRTAASANHIL